MVEELLTPRAVTAKVEPLITKRDMTVRTGIPTKLRLQITLRYFASGVSRRVIEELFRAPSPTISKIVAETAEAIWNVQQPEYIKCPSTEEEWLQIAKGFGDKWDYPFAL